MKYVVAGFGKFGKIALERLLSSFADPRIIIVESREDRRPAELPAHVRWIRADAVSFLRESPELLPEDVIIPMVPFHLLAAYVMATRPKCHEVPLPDALETILPHPFRIGSSALCCSRADFLCPDDCPEGEVCTVTGEPREPLHAAIEAVAVPGFTVLVQKSFQILPGVGGYPLSRLADIASKVTHGQYPDRYLMQMSCNTHRGDCLTGDVNEQYIRKATWRNGSKSCHGVDPISDRG